MKRGLVCLFVLVSTVPVLAMDHNPGDRHTTPVVDCEKLPPPLKMLVAAMERPGRKIEALAVRGSMVPLPLMPKIQRLDVALRPAEEVTLTSVRMGKPDGWEDTFAGLLELRVPQDGIYRISASASTWIDVLSSDTAIPRMRPNHRLHRCGQVHKSIEFPLKKDDSYWLELSSSKSPMLSLMITLEE
jgi:hypothetical protein